MKYNLLPFFLFFSSILSFSQNDTNNVMQRQIEIEKSLKNLQLGLENFEEQITTKQQQIQIWSDSIQFITIGNTGTRTNHQIIIDSLETLITNNEQIIAALNNGIQDITATIIDLNNEISTLSYIDTTYSVENRTDIDDYDEVNVDYSFRRKKKFRGHWFGVNFGLNSYVTPDYSFNYPEGELFMDVQLNKSWEVSTNFIQFSIPFFNRYVGAVTGFGIKYNSYDLIQNITLGVDSNAILNYTQFNIDLRKNKFKTTSLSVPLILEFHIPTDKKDRRLYIAAGLIGNFTFQTNMKLKYKEDGSWRKIRDKTTDFRINKFNYTVTVRIGYRNLYLFTNYSFIPLFEQNFGPELHPVSAGLGISL